MDDLDDFFDILDNYGESGEDDSDEEFNIRIPKRYVRDALNPLEFYYDNTFLRKYKFTKDEVVNYLLPLVEPDLVRINNRGLPLPPLTELLATLRFMASSSYQAVVADLHFVSQASICLAIQRVSASFARRLNEFVHFPETDQGVLDNIVRNHRIAGFMEVSGVIDGCLVKLRSPPRAFAEVFRCRKGYFAINILACVGPKREFLFVDVRHPGSTHDQTSFERSALRVWYAQQRFRGLLLGDNGYGSRPYLLTPILRPLTQQQRRYNRSHIPTRTTIERTFGRWKAKFSCVKRGLLNNVNNSIAIIVATCVLWNIHLNLHIPNTEVTAQERAEYEAFVVQDIPRNVNGLVYRREFIARYF